jgi:hypothetical protein
MQGRAYLDLAVEIVAGGTELHWRGAVGRAYYALMLECRDALFRWGFKLPPRDRVHSFVRLRFTYPADQDLKQIGWVLDRLASARNRADYDLSTQVDFSSSTLANQALANVTAYIALLDAIDADTTRRAAAIAAIKKAFP